MSEIVKLSAENAPKILVTQRLIQENKYGDLMLRIMRGRWNPDPPIVLSRMPETYSGQFGFHLYNGTHRYLAAITHGVELNGLVVTSVDEIPEYEQIKGDAAVWSPNTRLEHGLRSYLALSGVITSERGLTRLPKTLEGDFGRLLEELQRQEAVGILHQGFYMR